MRVLAFNQFYAPDHSATSQLLTDLCEDLVAAGDEVTVVASPGGYQGGAKLERREVIAGVQVVRPWATGLGKGSRTARLTDYGTFWASATLQSLIEARPDVVLTLSTPPLLASGVAVGAKLRRVPLVYWVQDVYPELAVKLGVLSSGSTTARALAKVAAATYANSDRIVALSECMASRLVRAGAPVERLEVLANWADGACVRPTDRETNAFRQRHELGGKFVVMYSGNLGAVHDVATIVDAARKCQTLVPSAVFLFVGDGVRRAEAQQLASGLPNVRFLPYQARETLGDSLSAGDVHVVSLRDGLEGLVVPSKFYGALASGRPVCFVGPADSEVARAIREDQLGWCGAPGDSSGLAHAVSAMAARADFAAEHCRIRRVFIAKYDRHVATAKWGSLLRDVASLTIGHRPELNNTGPAATNQI